MTPLPPPTTPLRRLRGLKSLVQDAVMEGSKAIERVQLATAARPFWVLERIAPLAKPARQIHVIHDVLVSGTYGLVRLWTRAIGTTLDVVLDLAEPPTPPT